VTVSEAELESGSADVVRLSEVFDSLQGEGVSQGMPCRFVRLALCNLHCHYCDTKYTWDFEHFDFASEVKTVPVSELVEQFRSAPSKRVVVTGGEPLLQQRALAKVLAQVPADVYVEVETNGTRVPSAALLARIDQWNVSPKLSSAGDTEALRIRPEALTALQGSGRAYLKIVVKSELDRDEAEALRQRFGFPRERTLLMPEAATPEELDARSPSVAAWSQSLGVRFGSRLHISLWGGRRGT
jgi:7-carboxy-7-deazaguanine synthase